MTRPYAGDLPAAEAFKGLAGGDAVLIDVRTAAEWTYVGGPDPEKIGVPLVRLEWQSFPGMAVNPSFAETLGQALEENGIKPDTPLFFLCRSGARSAAAAAAMTARGFSRCFNISDGFEGAPDGEGHRGQVNGWKAAGLPWRQG